MYQGSMHLLSVNKLPDLMFKYHNHTFIPFLANANFMQPGASIETDIHVDTFSWQIAKGHASQITCWMN